MRNRIQLSNVRYLGGHWSHPKPIDKAVLVIDGDGFHLRVFTEKFAISWSDVASVIVEGPEAAAKRVTVTRLATIGVFAFAAKKNTTETYLQVDLPSGDSISFVVPKMAAGELRGKLAPWTSGLPARRSTAASSQAVSPPPAPSVADELAKLAKLRDSGVLSPAEFEAQKARLLH